MEELKADAAELEKIPEKEKTDQTSGGESGTSEVNDVAIKISELVDFERIVFDDKSSIFVTTNGQDELKMVFKDECWTEVDEDALGRIYNDLNVAGDELTIRGQSPFKCS